MKLLCSVAVLDRRPLAWNKLFRTNLTCTKTNLVGTVYVLPCARNNHYKDKMMAQQDERRVEVLFIPFGNYSYNCGGTQLAQWRGWTMLNPGKEKDFVIRYSWQKPSNKRLQFAKCHFFLPVPKSSTPTGLICVNNPLLNISCLDPFKKREGCYCVQYVWQRNF